MSFVITSSDFPIARSQGHGISLGQVIGPPDVMGVAIAIYQKYENPLVEGEERVAVPAGAIADGVDVRVVTLPLVAQEVFEGPSTLEALKTESITQVVVGGIAYIEADDMADPSDPPVAGTFVFNASNNQLTLYSSPEASPNEGESIVCQAILDRPVIYSNNYTGQLPPLLRKWNAIGPVAFDRSLEESPSGSFQFLADRETFDPCDIAEGTTLEWEGEGYGVARVSAEYNPLQTDGLMTVSVSLQGPHDHLIDEQVRYRGAISQISGGALGVVSSTSADDDDAKSTVNIPFSSLCARGGVRFIGPSVNIRIDKERDRRDSTTIGSELGRSRSAECFADLSNPAGIEFREWFNPTVHNVARSEILNGYDGDTPTPISIEYNITGADWRGVKLAVEYLNTQLNLDNDEGGDEANNGRVNVTITTRSGDGLPSGGGGEVFRPPQGVDRSVASNAFDVGGPKREIIEETRFNGTLIARSVERKGYVYKCADYSSPVLISDQYINTATGQVASGPGSGIVLLPTSFGNSFTPEARGNGTAAVNRWETVEFEQEDFGFDGDDYLVRSSKTIATKRRYKQESDRRETLILQGQKALLQRWLLVFGSNANYTVSDRTISVDPNGEGNYQELIDSIDGELSQYDFFDVTERDTTDYELASLEPIYPDLPPREDGEPERKYVKSMRRRHSAIYETNDLSINAPDSLLTISTGENKEETQETTIIYPTGGNTSGNYNPDDDLYKTTTTYKRSSGQNFKNVYAEPGVDEEIRGKPQQAQRREVFEEGRNPTPDEEEAEERTTFLLNTPNNGRSPQTDAIDGSVQFPSTHSKAAGLRAAICDASIGNTQAVEVWRDLRLAPIRHYRVGDRIRHRGRKYRILSVSDRPEIQARVVKRDFLLVSWGREIDLRDAVTLSEVD